MAFTTTPIASGGFRFVSDGAGDSITGSEFKDQFLGNGGDDTMSGLGGDDRFNGGEGNDYVDGGADNDVLQDDTGSDVLIGGYGNDKAMGGADDDIILGFNGVVTFFEGGVSIGTDGNPMDTGNDTLNGGDGNDFVAGGGGDDLIRGGTGDDGLIGDEGRDTICGGSGNDTITGDELNPDVLGANDRLHGGLGSDRFQFINHFADDVVSDFKVAQSDLIDLTYFAGLTLEDLNLADSNNLDVNGDGIGDGVAGVIITSDWFSDSSISLVGAHVPQLTEASFLFAPPPPDTII